MKKNTKYFWTIILIISIFFNICGCSIYKKTNSGKVNLNWYMKLTDNSENPYTIKGEGEIIAVSLEDNYSDQFAIKRDNQIFLNIDTVINNIDRRFYWGKNDKIVMFTDAHNIYETNLESKKIGDETVDYVTCFTDSKKCYVNINFINKFIDMDYKLVEEKDGIPARVCLNYLSGTKAVMTVDSDIEMRTGADYQNLIVSTISEDSKVTVIEGTENWKKVRTEDGLIGYLPVSELIDEKKENQSYQSDLEDYTHTLIEGKVSLAWNQVTSIYANNNISELLKHVHGLNVISPTWFSVSDKNGTINSLASSEYIKKAKKSGLQVWALFSDLNEKGRKHMAHILAHKNIRTNMINQLMYSVNRYQIDGINIDFENVSENSAADYLQFLRELSTRCRDNNIVLSIDNYVPTSVNEYFDREQQAMLADYIIVMSYDEHATSADGAGSVSSMSFTEKGIKDTVDEVGDASRVINGMPFYTTVWTQTPEAYSDGSGTYYEDSANGSYYLTSQDIPMQTAKKLYKAAGATPVYDDNTGQNHVSYQNENDFVQIWLEDETSVAKRLNLMKQYEIGGAAYWALGQETDNIWSVIKQYF